MEVFAPNRTKQRLSGAGSAEFELLSHEEPPEGRFGVYREKTNLWGSYVKLRGSQEKSLVSVAHNKGNISL
jgi:hypothetical protein